MGEILQFFNKITALGKVIVLTVATALAIFTLRNLFEILQQLKSFLIGLFRFFRFLIRLLLKLLVLLKNALVYLLSTYSRHQYRKQLKASIYNVVPKEYEIPFRYRFFSRKIRKQALKRLYKVEKCEHSKAFIDRHIKYIAMLDASVGGGKTSFLAGLSHYRTLYYQEEALKKCAWIEKIIIEPNYEEIRDIIASCYRLGETKAKIVDAVLEKNKHAFQGLYSDYVSEVPKISLLEKYITAYEAILRNNYVMSNFKLENRITKTFNIDLPGNLFNIRDETARKNYFIPSYCTLIDDEKALSAYKNTQDAKSIDKTGVDIVMRLFRQLNEETNTYISSTQNTSRIAMMIRELANTYISIESFDVIGNQAKYSYKLYKKEHKLFKKMMKSLKKIPIEEQESYLLKNNSYKEAILTMFQQQKAVFASAYVKYSIKVTHRLRDKESDTSQNAIETEIMFPLTWVFGVYRTCEYSEFQDFLLKISNKDDHDLKIITSLYESLEDRYQELIKPLITQVEKKKAEKKAKKGGEE